MLGYTNSNDVYRVYDPNSRTVQLISSAAFDEQPKCRMKQSQPTDSSSDDSSDSGSSSESSDNEVEQSVPQLGTRTRTRKVYTQNPDRISSLRSFNKKEKSQPKPESPKSTTKSQPLNSSSPKSPKPADTTATTTSIELAEVFSNCFIDAALILPSGVEPDTFPGPNFPYYLTSLRRFLVNVFTT